ncbi:DUF5074 domain-containing protein [Spirosoma sp. RP8]|uniref:DUF5074 domain-containing protein n=1 Tax=Spirosoma liriopis TaxID=2937440 RepID=A0ABT0HEU1_9BACT|nr:DUF5074 domain-containing protein [Spirosoma liriopis]MCK8490671.1 DUF5074 domain-containing protein [Spirosoma liriopis]
MRTLLLNSLSLAFLTLFSGACHVGDAPPSPYERGAYVVNAGSPSANNGTISFIARNTNTVTNDVFTAANGRSLTGIIKDYVEIDGKGVILLDNNAAGQDKVEVVESGTFKSLVTFQSPDVENPRFVIYAAPNKAYISCWDAVGSGGNAFANPGYILVLNLASRTVSKKIPVPKGAERMVLVDKEVFVGSAGGERVLTVINTDTDEVVQPGIDAGVNANPVGYDFNQKLWAYVPSTNEMVRINPATKLVETRLRVGNGSRTPSAITLSADRKLFFFVNSYNDNGRLRGETYRFSINDTDIQASTPFIRRFFSGLSTDPNDARGLIYAAVTPSNDQPGYVLRYQPNGALVDSVRVGIAPSRFFFR